MTAYDGSHQRLAPMDRHLLAWRCAVCNALLAWVDRETRTEVRIKYKDLFAWIKKAESIRIACRNCGTVNEAKEDPPSAQPAA